MSFVSHALNMIFAQRCFCCEGPISYCPLTYPCGGGCTKNICRREMEHSLASFPRGIHNACYDCNNQLNIEQRIETEELLKKQFGQDYHNYVMEVQDEIILDELTQATQEAYNSIDMAKEVVEEQIQERAQQVLQSQEDTQHQVLGRPYSVEIQVGRKPKRPTRADRELVKIQAKSFNNPRNLSLSQMKSIADFQAIGRQENHSAEKRLRTCRMQNGVRVQFRAPSVYTA